MDDKASAKLKKTFSQLGKLLCLLLLLGVVACDEDQEAATVHSSESSNISHERSSSENVRGAREVAALEDLFSDYGDDLNSITHDLFDTEPIDIDQIVLGDPDFESSLFLADMQDSVLLAEDFLRTNSASR